MFTKLLLAALLALAAPVQAFAEATIPTKDIAGAKDNPLIKRYDGSFIVSYERLAFTDFKVPLSPLEATDGRDRMNNQLFLPKKAVEVEGARTRIAYLLPADRSPLEVLRNYEDVVKAAGGEVLFTCKGDACGGDPNRSSAGGGGHSSLMMYFVVESQLKDASFSNGACAQASGIDDQRFFAAKIPQSAGDAYVTVHTFQISDTLYCKAFNGRTVAIVHVLEPKPRDQKMVVVKADEMARTIGSTGRVALYGIFFEFDKADLKAEFQSDAHGDRAAPEERSETCDPDRRPHRQPGRLRLQHRALAAPGRGRRSRRWSPAMAPTPSGCAARASACWRRPPPTMPRRAGPRTGASRSSN